MKKFFLIMVVCNSSFSLCARGGGVSGVSRPSVVTYAKEGSVLKSTSAYQLHKMQPTLYGTSFNVSFYANAPSGSGSESVRSSRTKNNVVKYGVAGGVALVLGMYAINKVYDIIVTPEAWVTIVKKTFAAQLLSKLGNWSGDWLGYMVAAGGTAVLSVLVGALIGGKGGGPIGSPIG